MLKGPASIKSFQNTNWCYGQIVSETQPNNNNKKIQQNQEGE